jgi:hypothetical protein
MAEAPETLDQAQLLAKIKQALESWPLYRKFQYTGAETARVPEHISLFCPTCKKPQSWQTRWIGGANNRIGFDDTTYTCRNCGAQSIRYYFYWATRNEVSEFFKVGQWPPLDESVTDELQKLLDEEDLDFYKKAIRMRNHNMGIAAVA